MWRWFIRCYFFAVINVYCKSEFLTRLTEYLSDDLSVDSVNLIIDSPANLSSKAMLIMQRLIVSLPSTVVSGQALNLSKPQDRHERIREVLSRKLEHGTLKILVIDVRDKVEIKKLLMYYMNLFTYYPSEYKRSKCLIIVISQVGISFDVTEFFKHTWSLFFLYVTLINVNDTIDKGIPVRIEDSDVTVYQYNPFRNDTYQLPYVGNEKLFVNKLKNLHGYRLNVAFFEDIPLVMLKRNHPTNQVLTDDLYGVDVIISKTLAEAMNFTLYVKLNSSGSTPKVLFQHLRNNSVDFVVNIMTSTGYSKLNVNHNDSFSIFLQQYGHKILLKQQGYYEYNYFSYLLIIVVVAVTTATFSVLICLLPLHLTKSWNIYKIALLILGITPTVNLRRSSERIFYVSLMFISVIVSLQLLNSLLSNMLIERKFRNYESLADVVESNMVIGISKFVKSLLTVDSNIEKLFDASMDFNNFEGATGCVESLVTGSKPINGCDVNNVMADLVSKSYSDPNGEWTMGTMTGPDPFGAGMTWTSMSFALPSVYLDQCDVILQRLLESGLIPFWRNNHRAQWYFKRSTSNHFKNESFKFKNPRDQARVVLEYRTVELNEQMIGVLTLGWGISCLSFLLEIIWRAFKTMHIRKKTMQIRRDNFEIDY